MVTLLPAQYLSNELLVRISKKGGKVFSLPPFFISGVIPTPAHMTAGVNLAGIYSSMLSFLWKQESKKDRFPLTDCGNDTKKRLPRHVVPRNDACYFLLFFFRRFFPLFDYPGSDEDKKVPLLYRTSYFLLKKPA